MEGPFAVLLSDGRSLRGTDNVRPSSLCESSPYLVRRISGISDEDWYESTSVDDVDRMLPVTATDDRLNEFPPTSDIDAKFSRTVVWDPAELLITCVYKQSACVVSAL
jgi:hypothetical protein